MVTIPEGVVMLGGELDEKVSMGYVTRALLSILVKFCMNLNKYLDVNLGDEPCENGKYEVPHLTFPLFRVMDRVVVTAPGEVPPTLGSELPEPDHDRNLRRSGKAPEMQFKPDHIYSFSFHSMYIDFASWSLVNFPGYKSIDLKTFIGDQRIKIVVYEVKRPDNYDPAVKIPHHVCLKRYLTVMEMTHACLMTPKELSEADEAYDTPTQTQPPVDDVEGESNDIPIEEMDKHYTGRSDSFWDSAGQQTANNDDEEAVFSQACSSDDDASETRSEHNDAAVQASVAHNYSPVEDDKLYVHVNVPVALISNDALWENAAGSTMDASAADSELTSSYDNDGKESDDDDMHIFSPETEDVSSQSQPPPSSSGSSMQSSSSSKYCGVVDHGGFAFREERNMPTMVRFIRLESETMMSPLRSSLASFRRLSMLRMPSEDKAGLSSSPPSNDKMDYAGTGAGAGHEDMLSRREYLCTGDTVLVQGVTLGSYITVYRGWWVGFTNDISLAKAKGRFTVTVLNPATQLPLPPGIPIKLNTQFRLRSTKWPSWEVRFYTVFDVFLYLILNILHIDQVGYYIRGNFNRGGLSIVLFQLPRSMASPDRPLRWTKNGRLISSMSLSVIPAPPLPLPADDVKSSLREETAIDSSSEHTEQKKKPANTLVEDYFQVESNEVFEEKSENALTAFPLLSEGYNELPLVIKVSGWLEMMSRTTNRTIFCYIIACTLGKGSDQKHWTTLRSQEDVDAMMMDVPEDALRDGEEYQPSASDRDVAVAAQSLVQKLTMRKKWTKLDFQEQYSNDQKVQLIGYRFSKILEKANENSMHASTQETVEGAVDSADNDAKLHRASTPTKCENANSSDLSSSNLSNCANSISSSFIKVLGVPNLLDSWFLSGSPQKNIRLPPSKSKVPVPDPLVAYVARAWWETHWREEIMVLFPSYISFFRPGESKSHWNLPLQDLTGISNVSSEHSPLPGFSLLRLETIGRCHYVAFVTKKMNEKMASVLLEHFSELTFDTNMPTGDLGGDPRDKFVLKSGRWQSSTRLILNARKFSFDFQPNSTTAQAKLSYCDFSCSLLQNVFDLDPAMQSKSMQGVNLSSTPTGATGSLVSGDLFPGRLVSYISSLTVNIFSSHSSQ